MKVGSKIMFTNVWNPRNQLPVRLPNRLPVQQNRPTPQMNQWRAPVTGGSSGFPTVNLNPPQSIPELPQQTFNSGPQPGIFNNYPVPQSGGDGEYQAPNQTPYIPYVSGPAPNQTPYIPYTPSGPAPNQTPYTSSNPYTPLASIGPSGPGPVDTGENTEIMNRYRKLMDSPDRTYTNINPERIQYQSSPEEAGLFTLLKGLTENGGINEAEQGSLRERGISPIRSIYANAQRNLERKRSLQGGYSPGFAGATSRMARELSEQISGQTNNVNAGIAEMQQRGRLASAPMLADATGRKTDWMNKIGFQNADATNNANQFNANMALNNDKFNSERKTDALSGMNTTAGLMQRFKEMVAQREQNGNENQLAGQRNELQNRELYQRSETAGRESNERNNQNSLDNWFKQQQFGQQNNQQNNQYNQQNNQNASDNWFKQQQLNQQGNQQNNQYNQNASDNWFKQQQLKQSGSQQNNQVNQNAFENWFKQQQLGQQGGSTLIDAYLRGMR